MKIVNLIEVETPVLVMFLSGSEMGFFGDTIEEFDIQDGDVVIARGKNELYMGIAREYKSPAGPEYDTLLLTDVKISYYFCNI
jgi:hypothetical protein